MIFKRAFFALFLFGCRLLHWTLPGRRKTSRRIRFGTSDGGDVFLWVGAPTLKQEERIESVADPEEANRLRRQLYIFGWDGVLAADGRPIPFNQHNLNVVLSLDAILEDRVDAYLWALPCIY